MTLKELKIVVDRTLQQRESNEDLKVCIPNNKVGMGGISTTRVRTAHRGIDWDKGMFIIWPEFEMVERNNEGK